MPFKTVPLSSSDPAARVAETIAEIEADGGELVGSPAQVGDQIMIVYKNKPRVGRPPKTETRG